MISFMVYEASEVIITKVNRSEFGLIGPKRFHKIDPRTEPWVVIGIAPIQLLVITWSTFFVQVWIVERQNVEWQNVKCQNVEWQNVERQNVNQQNVKRQNVELQNVERQNIELQNVELQNVKQQNF
jgi:hypothetical protein